MTPRKKTVGAESAGTIRVFVGLCFLRLAEERGLEPVGQLRVLLKKKELLDPAFALLTQAGRRYRSPLLAPPQRDGLSEGRLRDFVTGLYGVTTAPHAITDLGRMYERFLGNSGPRKAAGIYYTPDPMIRAVVDATLGRSLAELSPGQGKPVRVLDPACGCGAFLLGAYECLRAWYRRHPKLAPAAIARQILQDHLYGVDRDPTAVEVTRLSLILKAAEDETLPNGRGSFAPWNLRCGDALLGPDFLDGESPGLDWRQEFPAAMSEGGFSVVLGNPPWGQKDIDADPARKRYLAERFPSSAGIHDLFRPFVELGVRLTAPSGRFGMVLPDIILLKDYPQTRRFLLEQLALERIEWWGQTFRAAAIDTVFLAGRKESALPDQAVTVHIHEEPPLAHTILQADFLANPRYVFNLHLTPARRRWLERLAACPRLGDYFEIHEGVHSGNIRAELFVPEAVDASCRTLLFGRDEIAPYRLHWRGRYIRLAALPDRRTPERYANLGRAEWHERPKLLVRRTGDHLLAAVDNEGRYASNNFFLVFPRRPCSLNLDGLCALLNSRRMTWYFRALEPRRGRAFAELKIKHLRAFPLPKRIGEANGCRRLNERGARRRLDGSRDC